MVNPSHNKKEDGQDSCFPSMPPLLPVASTTTCSRIENVHDEEYRGVKYRNKETLNPTPYQSIVHQYDSSRPSIAEVLFSKNADISQVENSIDADSVQQKKQQRREDTTSKVKNNDTPSASQKKEKEKEVASSSQQVEVQGRNMPLPASSNNNAYYRQHNSGSNYPSSSMISTQPYNYDNSSYGPNRSSSYAYPPPFSSHHQHDYRHDYYRQAYGHHHQPPPPPAPTSTITEYLYTASTANYTVPPPMPKYDAKYEEHLQKRMRITDARTLFLPPPITSNNTPFKYSNKEEEEERARIVEEIYGNKQKNNVKHEEERRKIVEKIYGKRRNNEEHESLVKDVLSSSSSHFNDDEKKKQKANDNESSTSSTSTFTKKKSSHDEQVKKYGYLLKKDISPQEMGKGNVIRKQKANADKSSTSSSDRCTEPKSSYDEQVKKYGYLLKKDITSKELRKLHVIRRKKIKVKGATKNDVIFTTDINWRRYYAQSHNGNTQFNELIMKELNKWKTCLHSEKYQLIESIKTQIEELDPPGRFLELVEKSNEISSDTFRVMNNTEIHVKIKSQFTIKSRASRIGQQESTAPKKTKQKDTGPSLQDLQKKYKEKLIIEPTKHDVLPTVSLRTGKEGDARNTNHEGNKYFIDLINSKAEQYAKFSSDSCTDKDLKFKLIFDVMDHMKALDPPGRFLREVGMNAYVPLISEKVYEKIRRQFIATVKARALLQK